MSIAKKLASSFTVLLMAVGLSGMARGQDVDKVESERIARFLARVVAEREKLVMFQYDCTITSSSDGLLRERFPKNLKIRYEYSKIDNHEILIADYSECEAGQKRPTFWIGRSGKYVISGKKGVG